MKYFYKTPFKKSFYKKPIVKSRALRKRPHKLGAVERLRITTPRKPNSAKRKTVKLYFLYLKPYCTVYIPGYGHNLKKNSKVLMRGGGPRDLPGVYTSCVRGSYDLQGVNSKTKRRSIYGVKKPLNN